VAISGDKQDITITDIAPPNPCGNGTCDAGETSATCPADCPPPPNPCGNGVCDAGETYASCPVDCPPPPTPITLTYTAKRVQGPDWDITFKWSGAVGDTVKLYRSSAISTTANDGSDVYRAHNREKGFQAKVCDTAQCSRTVTVNW
jgi:hypothetical protein